MISTLIRSKDPSLVGLNGSNEYLVDTENNKIVYPYTLLENILGRNENGDIMPPNGNSDIVIGGGSTFKPFNDSGYIDISGVTIPAANSDTVIGRVHKSDYPSGVYLLHIFINQASFTNAPYGKGRYKYIHVYRDAGFLLNYTTVIETDSGWIGYSDTIPYIVKEDGIFDMYVMHSNSIDTTTRVIAANSSINWKMIKVS